MFTNKKRECINAFVCAVCRHVAEISEITKASIKDHKPPLPIIPLGIVAHGFAGQPFSKQLYTLKHQERTRAVLYYHSYHTRSLRLSR